MISEIVNGWYSEFCPLWPGRALSIKVEENLFDQKSPFQHIQVFRSKNCGVMLVLDGIIQCTESDEFAYQEMMVHPALFAHPDPRRVLVIGGGDGGVLREVARHDCVEAIDICEIDGMVIEAAKRFLPSMAVGFDDPRVAVHVADGNEFIKDRSDYYDVIIVDSTDPVGPAEALFEEPFYRGMRGALRDGGVIAAQGESFFMHREVVAGLMGIMKKLFPVHGYAYTLVPTYPGGNIGVAMGSLGPRLEKPSRFPDTETQAQLRYYTPKIHEAAFVLPAFGERMMAEL